MKTLGLNALRLVAFCAAVYWTARFVLAMVLG